MCIIFRLRSISPSLPAKSTVRSMRALYFSYYDIPRDTNSEIEKSPVREITPSRYQRSKRETRAAAVAVQVVKMNYFIRDYRVCGIDRDACTHYFRCLKSNLSRFQC